MEMWMDFEEFLTVSTLHPLIAGKAMCLKALGKINVPWELTLPVKQRTNIPILRQRSYIFLSKTIEWPSRRSLINLSLYCSSCHWRGIIFAIDAHVRVIHTAINGPECWTEKNCWGCFLTRYQSFNVLWFSISFL